MDIQEIRERKLAVERAVRARDEAVFGFVSETARLVAERLPGALGIDPCFAFESQRADSYVDLSDYEDSNEIFCMAAIPLGTMVRAMIDGGGRRAEKWKRYLSENGYSDFRSAPALAFAAGFDDNSVHMRDPEKDAAESARKCPGWPKDYHEGRLARREARENGKDVDRDCIGIPRSFSRDWLVIMLSAPDAKKIRLFAKLSDTDMPDVDDDDWAEIRKFGTASEAADVVIGKIVSAKAPRKAKAQKPC